MKPIGGLPNNISDELKQAWAIVQANDRSSAKLNALIQLQQRAQEADKTKIGDLIEAFLASE